uniref:Uncharacterized protein n=1 Tax=Opuntia streptacantha TaxID=393608 RepID=A0A7C8ZGG3_OPUST
MPLKPKKPPDPSQPHLLCSPLPSLHSFSFGIQSLSSVIEHHLKPSMPTILRWCSSPSSFLAAKIGSSAPEGKSTTLQIRIRSRSVLFRAISRYHSISATTALDIHFQEILHEEDGVAPLNRFGIVSPLCEFQISLLL